MEFWNQIVHLAFGDFSLSYPLWYWVNDGLMTIFFFVIGLEIKRELVLGELRDRRRVILPVSAAILGALLPALIFLYIQGGKPGEGGWAIPMATDIAFVVGALTILGKRIPHGLKVFLLSLAIMDDIIAVIVIAVFYSSGIKLIALILAGLGLLLMIIMNKVGVRNVWIYVFIGAGIWLATLKSGIHPTIAGVAMGLLAPVTALISREKLISYLDSIGLQIRNEGEKSLKENFRVLLEKTEFTSREAMPPLERIESALHPWVAFAIIPIFALANAAIPVSINQIGDSLMIAAASGLVFGKPIGIFLISFILVKLKITALPRDVNWLMMLGAGCLAGIGFTMSLFIASLNLSGDLLDTAKTGIILGSLVSLFLGMMILSLKLNKSK
jgi:NhaA family Na+:H+ antiporter